ncbi:helix-turn-helix domain-containing protein [Jeotgalibacillus proteolyticus]|uniref:Transcriptional regulator n=1 Tax=Jeotgalibacillus proteolyticus TaxID=2082395 RepID=A0A2S5GA90_9BACL|nr:helix-turn-helix transcriptional regulator [Jeotgalibacillus proteolyticus]PPA69918.1 transcriptional regulator [Jeotgalibacillus proteolyticus]
MKELGERIRMLRKEKGMTLLDVAGDHLSKGMLSLIENGHAKPSMESLNWIAKQLGIEVHVLLEERSSEEIKQLLAKTEDLIEEAESKPYSELKKHYHEVYLTLAPVYEQALPTTYETGRLYELGGRCLMNTEEKEKGKQLIQKAIAMYESLSLYNQAFKAKSRFVYEKLQEENYQEGLHYLYKIINEYKEKIIVLEPTVQIDYDFLEMITLFATGEYTEGKAVLDRLITFSKRKGVFYRMDDIYRVGAFYALLHKDIDSFNRYLLKAKQFAEFTDSSGSIAASQLIEAHYHNELTKDFDRALSILNEEKTFAPLFVHESSGYYYLEKGKAYLGKEMVDDALEQFDQFFFPLQPSHPFDLAMLSTIDSYRALAWLEKGDISKALSYAESSIDLVAPLPETPYHKFIEETLERIKMKAK